MTGSRKARVSLAEQIRLINEYRQSGVIDDYFAVGDPERNSVPLH